MTVLSIPDFALVVLIGTTESGKSTFATKFFKPNEILSSAQLRALIADREGALEVAAEAFELLMHIAEKRLSRRLLTVVDASNLQPEIRKALVALAKNWDAPAIAIVFAPDQSHQGHAGSLEEQALHAHQQLQLQAALRALPHEGFRSLSILNTRSLIQEATVERTPLNCNRSTLHGPFDIIGDVHGCWEELKELLENLGYRFEVSGDQEIAVPPFKRTAIFLGDLIDRGPEPLKCLQCAMNMVSKGYALLLPGNHEEKMIRYLAGKKVSGDHGFQETMEQLLTCDFEYLKEIGQFLRGLPYHYLLDEGKLVVAHAGLKERYQGRESGRVKAFALYGDTMGERDELGLPVRSNWALEYWGKALVVYGHTPVRQPLWINRSVNIDTGCVFGGYLTALRYPELELVSIASKKVYTPPKRFLEPYEEELTSQDSLQMPDESEGIQTTLAGIIHPQKEGVIAALETIRESTLDPQGFVHLPIKPPVVGSGESALQASFRAYASNGIRKLYCRQNVGGVPVTLLLCRNERITRQRFGLSKATLGVCFNARLYEPFQTYPLLGTQFFERLHEAVTRAGLWERLETPWIVFEGELLPISLGMGSAEADVNSSNLKLDWALQGLDSLRFFPGLCVAVEGRLLLEESILVQDELLALFRHQDPHLLRAQHNIQVDLKELYSKESAQRWWQSGMQEGWAGCDVFPTLSPSLLVAKETPFFLRCMAQERSGGIILSREDLDSFFSQYALTQEHLRRVIDRESLQERLNSFFALLTKITG